MEENIRKFKLIKTYPGSPELGSVVKECYLGNPCGYYTLGKIIMGKMTLSKDYIENNPEFWEEIKELPVGTKVVDTYPDTKGYTYTKQKDGKWTLTNMDYYTISESSIGEGKRFRLVEEKPKKEYEIVEISCKNVFYEDVIIQYSGGIPTHRSDNKSILNTVSLKDFTKNDWEKHITITKIKRLSDNEVFSIGDYCNSNIISSFVLSENNELLIYSKVHNLCNCWTLTIDKLKKENKVPLFKSEDGEDMYVGDKYFRIISNWEIQEENVIQLGEHIYKNDTISRFSTKEKALEYIIENKPCLSISEIVKNENIYGNLGFEGSSMHNRLKELVKLK